MDLAKVVSTKETYDWTQTEWRLESGYGKQEAPKHRVVAFDYGVKYNILRMLAERGCHVTVLPAQATAADALALNPDGIFLSNGPGDPEPCDYAIAATREFIERGIPTFGICLGHQIMGLAVGAKTLKMKTGHHGANHPVKDHGRRARRDHVAEPRFRGRRRRRCPPTRRSRTSPCSTARCKASRSPTSPRSASRVTRKRRRDRTTSPICSTASSS